MQLLYIYLEKYRNFEKQGFSFSSEYNITFDESEEQITFKIEENPNHIENFFDDESILDVTAIIGENGSGKSNIINFVITSLTKNGIIPRNTFVLFKNSNTGEVNAYGLLEKKYELDSRLKINKNLNFVFGKQLEDLPMDVMNQRLAETDQIDFIYYSNNFDVQFTNDRIKELSLPRPNQSSKNNFFNISTQSKIYTDQLEDETQIIEPLNADVEAFGLHELHRNIDFILNQLNNNPKGLQTLDFTIPEDISLEFDNTVEQSIDLIEDQYNLLKDIFEQAVIHENNELRAKAKLGIIRVFSVQVLSYYGDYSDQILHAAKSVWYDRNSADLLEWFRVFLNEIETTKFADIKFDRTNLKTHSIIDFVEFIFSQIDSGRFQVEGLSEGILLLIHITEDNKNSIIDFYKIQNLLPTGIRPFYFSWRSLSSGEQSLLTLFSRFYELKKHPRFQVKSNKLILVDEGDLYFHPEWQRRYLNIFLRGITEILGKDNQFQFIFTANTPFLASDLPRDKVLMLRKEKQTDIIEGLSQYASSVFNGFENRTLASNIHTLLSDGFFLTSFLGEFAQEKIKKIADRLSDKEENLNISEREKEKIRITIYAIGEDIIRNRLIALYERKFGQPFSIQDLDQEINDLEVRLENLRLKRGGLNDQN